MMTNRALFTVVLALLAALAGTGTPARAGGPAPDIHAVDFRNFTYSNTGCAGEGETLTVKNGTFERDDEDDKVYFEITDVVFGDVTGDGLPEAAVLTLCNTGGTGQFTDAAIYTMRGTKPVLLDTLGVGDRADGGLYRVEIRNGIVYQDRFGHDEAGGACCPQFVETVPVRWNGKQFVSAGKSTRRGYQDYLSDDAPAPHAIRFLRGTSAATLVGVTNDAESYRLGARAGQTLTISINTKDSTTEAVVTTMEGQKLGSVSGAATLSIKLPATGDYLVTLHSSKAKDSDGENYAMELSIL